MQGVAGLKVQGVVGLKVQSVVGLKVQGEVGFRMHGVVGLKVQGVGSPLSFKGSRVQDAWFIVQGPGCTTQKFRFRDWSVGLKVQVLAAFFAGEHSQRIATAL